MAFKFRTAGVWGAGEGHDLSADEIDGNTQEAKSRIEALEAATAGGPKSIVSTTSPAPGSLTIHYSDGSTDTVPISVTSPPAPTYAVPASTHTLAAANVQKYHRCTNAGGCVVTVPLNSDVAIPVDSEFNFRVGPSAGAVTFIEGDSGVVINPVEGFEFGMHLKGAVATLKKVATDEWDLFGTLTPSSA